MSDSDVEDVIQAVSLIVNRHRIHQVKAWSEAKPIPS
jgi:hypothetical protein